MNKAFNSLPRKLIKNVVRASSQASRKIPVFPVPKENIAIGTPRLNSIIIPQGSKFVCRKVGLDAVYFTKSIRKCPATGSQVPVLNIMGVA